MEKGFNDSNLKLNAYLKNIDQWTTKEMSIREKLLTDLSLESWPMISSSFEVVNNSASTLTLSDDTDMSYYSISDFSLFGESQNVESWKDFYINVILKLYRMNQAKFIGAVSDNAFLKNYVNHSTLACFEIDTGLTFAHHMSTNAKLNILRTLFDSLNLDQSELSYNVKNDKNANESLWKKLKPDFDKKIVDALGTKGKYITWHGINVYEVISKGKLLRIKLSYSLDYKSRNPIYRGNGWFLLPKSIKDIEFTHIVFAVSNDENQFDYILFDKSRFVSLLAERFQDQNVNLNIYIGVTKNNEVFERRFENNLIVLSELLNNWGILNED